MKTAKSKEQVGVELLEQLSIFENGNGLRKVINKIMTQSLMDLGNSDGGAEDGYLMKFGFFFEQMDNVCNSLDEYIKIKEKERY